VRFIITSYLMPAQGTLIEHVKAAEPPRTVMLPNEQKNSQNSLQDFPRGEICQRTFLTDPRTNE
jgi:hypothetical protein